MTRPAFSAAIFASTARSSSMADPVDEMELCGLVSNMCVLSNAVVVKAACPECSVTVNEPLTMSFDPELHRKAMDVLRSIQIEVL